MGNDEQYDAFGDVIDETEGIYGGEALAAFSEARTTLMPTGVVVEMQCGHCQHLFQATIAWGAIIAMKYGLSPHILANHPELQAYRTEEWTIDKNGDWAPVTRGCPRCNTQQGGIARLRLGRGEPESFLQNARRRQLIQPNREESFSRICHDFVKRFGAAQRQQ